MFFCIQQRVHFVAEFNARQLDRQMRSEVRDSGKRTRDAYTDMIANVPKKFRSSDTQAAVIVKLPSYHEVRCQLSRHRTHGCTPVPDPLNIPDVLQTTLRGKESASDDPHKDEQFLLHSGQGGNRNHCSTCRMQCQRSRQTNQHGESK